jgi:hypothetical protein
MHRKEARGSPLFSYLHGVQKVGGSNLPAPTIVLKPFFRQEHLIISGEIKEGDNRWLKENMINIS